MRKYTPSYEGVDSVIELSVTVGRACAVVVTRASIAFVAECDGDGGSGENEQEDEGLHNVLRGVEVGAVTWRPRGRVFEACKLFISYFSPHRKRVLVPAQ